MGIRYCLTNLSLDFFCATCFAYLFCFVYKLLINLEKIEASPQNITLPMGNYFDAISQRAKKVRRGRRPRWLAERLRTILWSQSVRHASGLDYDEFETILGDDGRVNGLWSRYKNGHASPMRDRVLRIDKILPGTARYFFCPIWTLIESRRYSRDELDDAIRWLTPQYRDRFGPIDDQAFGRRWLPKADYEQKKREAVDSVIQLELGLDALTSLVIELREAEFLEHELNYLNSAVALAYAARYMSLHPILCYLDDTAIALIVEPMRNIKFANEEYQKVWEDRLSYFMTRKASDLNQISILECLLWRE